MTSIKICDLALIVSHNPIKTLPCNRPLVKNSCAALLECGGLDLQNWGAPFLPPIRVKTLVLSGFGDLQIQPPPYPIPHVKLSGKRFWFKALLGGMLPH